MHPGGITDSEFCKRYICSGRKAKNIDPCRKFVTIHYVLSAKDLEAIHRCIWKVSCPFLGGTGNWGPLQSPSFGRSKSNNPSLCALCLSFVLKFIRHLRPVKFLSKKHDRPPPSSVLSSAQTLTEIYCLSKVHFYIPSMLRITKDPGNYGLITDVNICKTSTCKSQVHILVTKSSLYGKIGSVSNAAGV